MTTPVETEDSRIGEILIAMKVITPEQRDAALAKQTSGDARTFGALVLSLDLAQLKDIELALYRQRVIRRKLKPAEAMRLLDQVRASMRRLGHSFDDLSMVTTEDLPTVQSESDIEEARNIARHLLTCVREKKDPEEWILQVIASWP